MIRVDQVRSISERNRNLPVQFSSAYFFIYFLVLLQSVVSSQRSSLTSVPSSCGSLCSLRSAESGAPVQLCHTKTTSQLARKSPRRRLLPMHNSSAVIGQDVLGEFLYFSNDTKVPQYDHFLKAVVIIHF